MQNSANLFARPVELPTFDAAISRLDRVPVLLYRALEHGAAKVAAYRDVEFPSERMDEGLAATMLRAHSRRFLKDNGVHAVDEDWLLDNLPFIGLSFHYDQLHVRVLKGSSGVVPGCGTSTPKLKFYNQVQASYLLGTQTLVTDANLLVLWDFTANYALSPLLLALPAKGGARSEEVSMYWKEIIPHPAEGGMPGTTSPLMPGGGGDLDDLIVAYEDTTKERVNER
jgi:hypothetical protein